MNIKLNNPFFKLIVAFVGAILFAGSVLDAFSNAISLIPANITYTLTVAIFVAAIVVHFWLKRKPFKITQADGTIVLHKGLNLKVVGILLGIAVILWIPRFFGTDTQPSALPIKTAEVQAPAFSISINTLFRGRPNSLHEGFWIADPKKRKMAPVPITMYVSFVNLQPHSSMIKSYDVDMQIKSGDWIKLKSIRVFEGSNFEPVFVFADGIARKADLVTFEEVISGSNIPPHEPKFGWMFFDVPTDYQIGQKLVFRFVVRDVTGGTSEILVNAPTEEEENQLKGTMANFRVKEKLPIESYEKGYFSKLF